MLIDNLYDNNHSGGNVYSVKGICPTITVSHGVECVKILVTKEKADDNIRKHFKE